MNILIRKEIVEIIEEFNGNLEFHITSCLEDFASQENLPSVDFNINNCDKYINYDKDLEIYLTANKVNIDDIILVSTMLAESFYRKIQAWGKHLEWELTGNKDG